MSKEIISNRQGISLLSIFMIGTAIILIPGKEAARDIWLALLLAILLEFPLLFVHTRLLRIFPGKDLFDLLQIAFGKIMGKGVALLYVWFAFHLGILVLRDFSEFIEVVSLNETPQYIVLMIMGVICIWAVKSGLEVLGRWAAFFLPVFIFTIIGLTVVLIPKMDFSHIQPVLYRGLTPVLKGGFSLFSFPFAEPVLFTFVFDALRNKEKTLHVYMISMFIAGACLITAYVRNILVLGEYSFLNLFFSSYAAASLVPLGNFFGRLEAFSGIVFFIGQFIKVSVCLYIASKGLGKILNVDQHCPFVAPLGLLMVCLASTLYSDTLEMFEWASEIYPYYTIPFYILLPLITLITMEMKVRLQK